MGLPTTPDLIVEDGSGVVGADVLTDLGGLAEYFLLNNYTLPTDEEEQKLGLRRGTRGVALFPPLYKRRWKGIKIDPAQPLWLPRANFDDGEYDASGTVPQGIIEATLEMALMVFAGIDTLRSRDQTDRLQSFAVSGAVNVQFEGGMSPHEIQDRYPAIMERVRPYTVAAGMRIRRV